MGEIRPGRYKSTRPGAPAQANLGRRHGRHQFSFAKRGETVRRSCGPCRAAKASFRTDERIRTSVRDRPVRSLTWGENVQDQIGPHEEDRPSKDHRSSAFGLHRRDGESESGRHDKMMAAARTPAAPAGARRPISRPPERAGEPVEQPRRRDPAPTVPRRPGRVGRRGERKRADLALPVSPRAGIRERTGRVRFASRLPLGRRALRFPASPTHGNGGRGHGPGLTAATGGGAEETRPAARG